MSLQLLHSRTLSATEKFHLYDKIHRNFIPLIDSREYMVLMFIYNRTVNWGKGAEFIRQKHFIEGIPDTIAGLPISVRTLKTVLQAMQQKGLIFRQVEKFGSWYAINWEWNVVMLKTPKNTDKSKGKTGLAAPKEGGAKVAPGVVQKLHHRRQIINKSTNTDHCEASSQSLEGREELSTSLSGAVSRVREKKVAKLERAKKFEKVSDMEKLWDATMRSVHPEHPLPVWSVVDRAKIKKFCEAYKRENENAKVWPLFLFCIENWHRIGKLRFSWMSKEPFPEYPDAVFIISFKKYFLHAFADKTFHEQQLFTSHRAREIKRLMREGYTQVQAEAEVDSSVEKSKVVGRYKQQTERAAIDIRAVQEENKRLKREKNFRDVEEGKRLIAEEKAKRLNPGSNPAPPKKKVKRDAEGYAIVDLPDVIEKIEWTDND